MIRKIHLFLSIRYVALLCAAAVFCIILAFGEMFLDTQAKEARNKLSMEAVSHASTLRARVERELSSLLYLSSGLGSYLVVRKDSIQAKEVNDILAVLYRSSRHVRNFGIAIGYRLTFIYPVQGNERAIGMLYSDQPAQWPIIKKIAQTGQPALAGPVALVQGGSGLIYRVPLSISGKYWGLLSTVIDADSFFQAIFEGSDDNRYDFAVRGKDGLGIQGEMIWGEQALFSDTTAVTQEIEIPGGRWVIAVKPQQDAYQKRLGFLTRMLSGGLGGLFAWMVFMLIRSRTELSRQALYDSLTGLPNRHLLEDRATMAFARQRRTPDQLCALLFLDLDGFKDINDRYGHKAGDAVLCAAAERAKAVLRLNDTVARWGGDEFIVLLENVTQSTLAILMERLRDAIEQPIEFEEWKLQVGVSIGMAIYPETGGSLGEILRIADGRMYEDKAGRNSP